jgi:hypothetical protein
MVLMAWGFAGSPHAAHRHAGTGAHAVDIADDAGRVVTLHIEMRRKIL